MYESTFTMSYTRMCFLQFLFPFFYSYSTISLSSFSVCVVFFFLHFSDDQSVCWCGCMRVDMGHLAIVVHISTLIPIMAYISMFFFFFFFFSVAFYVNTNRLALGTKNSAIETMAPERNITFIIIVIARIYEIIIQNYFFSCINIMYSMRLVLSVRVPNARAGRSSLNSSNREHLLHFPFSFSSLLFLFDHNFESLVIAQVGYDTTENMFYSVVYFINIWIVLRCRLNYIRSHSLWAHLLIEYEIKVYTMTDISMCGRLKTATDSRDKRNNIHLFLIS